MTTILRVNALKDESSAAEMKKKSKEMKVRVVKVIQYAIRT